MSSSQDRMGGKKVTDPRYVINHAGDPEYSLVTRVSDGQLMFLANMVSTMNDETAIGSRIAEVHNGSSLFTGDAGQGESNIRRWIIENDWLEAIVALPLFQLSARHLARLVNANEMQFGALVAQVVADIGQVAERNTGTRREVARLIDPSVVYP